MGLSNLIKQGLKAGFNALDDVPRPVTYRAQSGDPIRDIDAGTSIIPHVDYPIAKVLIYKFSVSENDKDATQQTDEKMLILSDDFPLEEANATDIVIDEHGKTWEVIKRLRDPVNATKIFQVRSTR